MSNHHIIQLIVSTGHCAIVKDEDCLSELLTGLLDVLPIENGINTIVQLSVLICKRFCHG